MTKNSKEINKYRRLKRKAKRLKRQRKGILGFVLYKIFPFAFVQILLKNIFKKYSWITLFIFFIGLFYKGNNNFSNKHLLMELELKRTKEELLSIKLINKEQSSKITNLQKEILKWNQKYTQLDLKNQNRSEKKTIRIKELNKEIYYLEENIDYILQKNSELESELSSLNQQLQNESQTQKTLISQLKTEITLKSNELEFKQSNIVNLRKQLEEQQSDFYTQIEELKEKIKAFDIAMTETKNRDALQFIYFLIEKILKK